MCLFAGVQDLPRGFGTCGNRTAIDLRPGVCNARRDRLAQTECENHCGIDFSIDTKRAKLRGGRFFVGKLQRR